MTREEAREILTHNWTRVDNPNYSESELDEAFFMAIEALSNKPTDEWCTDCKEYDHEKHCCPRFNRVIRTTLNEAVANLKEEFELLPSAEADSTPRGVYQCFHCGSYSVVWGADFSFEDYGSEGEGIVHSCHCTNCGAEIEYWIPLNNEDE